MAITGNQTFNNWNWPNAMIFAATVITTIGECSGDLQGNAQLHGASRGTVLVKAVGPLAAWPSSTLVLGFSESLVTGHIGEPVRCPDLKVMDSLVVGATQEAELVTH